MARSGSTLGTVVRWDDDKHAGLVEAPDLPGPCWVDSSVVHVHGAEGADLRAGQVVEVEWTESDEADVPLRATRVTRREDLQTGLGG
jgi:CspA family cold shock protein